MSLMSDIWFSHSVAIVLVLVLVLVLSFVLVSQQATKVTNTPGIFGLRYVCACLKFEYSPVLQDNAIYASHADVSFP